MSFSDNLEHFLPVSRDQTRHFITNGMVVVDTNVLLDLYRYTAPARNELLAALETLKDRLWVPFQVALEFHRNRISVISSHGDAYRELGKLIAEFRSKHETILLKGIREFSSRVSLPEAQQGQLVADASTSLIRVQEYVNTLQAQHGISDRFVADDPVLAKLQQLFDGKTGDCPKPAEAAEMKVEAEKRVRDEIPPGFKDSGKDDPTGDYILWAQSLREAERRKTDLLIVTRDNKGDWFLVVNGKTIGALPELVDEARRVHGVHFMAMSTKTFLLHAKDVLNTQVSESTLKQSEAMRVAEQPHGSRVIELSKEDVEAIRAELRGKIAISQRQLADEKNYQSHLDPALAEYVVDVAESASRSRLYKSRLLRTEGVLEEFEGGLTVSLAGNGTLVADDRLSRRLSDVYATIQRNNKRQSLEEKIYGSSQAVAESRVDHS